MPTIIPRTFSINNDDLSSVTPLDTTQNYYLDLNVNNVIQAGYHIDPIDSLQVLFDEWYLDNLDYILGDINSDGSLNVSDIVLIVDLILNSDYNEYSDMNQDGILNIIDVIDLVNIILRK